MIVARLITIVALIGCSTVSYAAPPIASIGDVSFQIGMPRERALLLARQSLAIIPISGTDKFFLFEKDLNGNRKGPALGGIGFSEGHLAQIRRDLGQLESSEALALGRRLAKSITESGYEEKPGSLLSQSYKEFSTANTITIQIKLPDRILRIRVYESNSPGTTSSLEATEHFGGSTFD